MGVGIALSGHALQAFQYRAIGAHAAAGGMDGSAHGGVWVYFWMLRLIVALFIRLIV